MPFDPSTAVAEPSGAEVKFDASTAVLDEPEPQSNSPMPPERQEPTAQITAEAEPGLLTRARESLSPLIGPTERQRSMGMVPFGKDADGNTIYRYKPLASRIEREGLLTTPLIEAPEPVKGPNPSGALLGSLLLGPSGIGGMLSEEHRTAVGNAVINTLSGIGQANILNLLIAPAALAATLPKTAKAVSAGFAIDMARHVPEQVKQAVTAPDLQGKLEGALGAVSGVALATMAGAHAIKSTAAPKGVEIPKVDGVKFNGVDEMGNYQFTDEANGGTFSVKEPTREAVEARRAVKQQEFAEPTATEADIDRILAEQAPKAAPSPGKITTKLSERLRSNDPEMRAKAWDEAKAMQEEEMLASDTPPVPEPIPQEPLAPPSESPLPFKLEETPATPAPVSESAKLDDLMSLIQRPKQAEPSPSTKESTAPSAPEARPPEKSKAVSPEKPKPLSAKEKERLNDLNRRLSDLEAERKFAADEGDQATVDSIGRVEARFRSERDALKERNVSEPQVTGIRNRIVDEERQKRGLPPAMEPARRSFGKVWDEAMRKVEDDPKAGEKLVTELQDKPRPLTDTEDALLTHEQITRQNAFDRAVEDVNSRPEDPSAVRALETARDELQAIYDAGKAAGTQSGRGLAARKLLVQDDYSLARMESTFRAEANQGKPLSAEQTAQIKDLHDRIAAAEKKLSEYEARQSESEAKRTFENLIRETKKGAREAKKTGGTLLDKLKSGHDEALKNIKSRMGRTSAGVDPTVLYDVARIGAYHIANGAVKFAEFTKRVVDEVGEWIRPSIKEVFDQAQKIHEEGQKAFEAATPKPTALEKAQANAAEGKPINPQQVFELAREKVNAGITELDKVMEAVHADLAPLHEGLTVRDVRDAFSGYGKVRYPSKAEDLTKLRELKNLARMASAIEDAQNKIAPKKTGAQRDKPTQAVRDMMKRLRDEMRKAGIETTSPEQQLASANQARATALRNQIEDLDRQLQTGEKAEQSKPIPDTEEVERLRSIRDAMKQAIADIEEATNPPKTAEQKALEARIKAAEKSVAELDRKLQEGDLSPKATKEGPTSPELERLQSIRDSMREQIRELQKAAEPKDSAEQKALDAAMVARERMDQKLQGAIESKAPAKEALTQMEEDIRLEVEAMKQLARDMKSAERDTRDAREQAQIKALEKAIEAYAAKTRARDFSTKGQKQGPDTQRIIELKTIRDSRRSMYEALKKASKPPVDKDAVRLAADKKRIQKAIDELKRRIAEEDYSKPVRREPLMDPEKLKLMSDRAAVRTEFDRAIERKRLEGRSRAEKLLDGIAKWRRTFVLTSPITLAKLTSAASEILAFTPIEEAAGGVIGRFIPRIAEAAPRHGGFNAAAERKAIVGTFKNLLKDAGDVWKTGNMDIDRIYGKPDIAPKELKDFIGHLHGALKTPAKRNEFIRSFEKRVEHAQRNRVDVHDPIVQTRLATEAYKDAKKSIFTEDNMVVSSYKRMLSAFEQKQKETGQPSLRGKIAATGLKYTLPIVRIPTNIVSRTFEYSLGTASGSVRAARAMWKGLDKLTPEEADHIMRNLKRGSLGAAVLLLGFFNPDNVGGYYQQGQKRDEEDVKYGELRIGDVDVPKYLIHNPLLEQLQIGATIRRVMDSKLRKRDVETQGLSSGVMAAMAGLLEEVPFVREMEDTLKTLSPHERKTYFGELAESAVPQAIQWAAKKLDTDIDGNPIKRAPETTLEHIESVIPVLRTNVPEKRTK